MEKEWGREGRGVERRLIGRGNIIFLLFFLHPSSKLSSLLRSCRRPRKAVAAPNFVAAAAAASAAAVGDGGREGGRGRTIFRRRERREGAACTLNGTENGRRRNRKTGRQTINGISCVRQTRCDSFCGILPLCCDPSPKKVQAVHSHMKVYGRVVFVGWLAGRRRRRRKRSSHCNGVTLLA